MAEVRKRGVDRHGRTKWEIRYYDADGKRHAKMFRSERDAKAHGAKQEHSVQQGMHISPRMGETLYREVVDAWRDSWVGLEPRTRSGYEQIIRAHLADEFGEVKVSAITSARVQSYVTRLHNKGLAAGTVRNIFATLRTSLNAAVRLQMIGRNPCVGVKVPRIKKQAMLILTAAEINDLTAAIAKPLIRSGPNKGKPAKPRPDLKTLVLTAAYTGLRAGELLALRRKDVDVLHQRIHVARALKEVCGRETEDWPDDEKGMVFGDTKNHLNRSVAIPKFLADELATYLSRSLASGSGPDALIFPDVNGGPLRHHNFYGRYFKPAVVRALPAEKHGLRFHDLRHTCASLLIAAGVHPKAIQERLGHSSITLTMDRYGHLMESAHKGVTDALDAAYDETQKPTNVTPLRPAKDA